MCLAMIVVQGHALPLKLLPVPFADQVRSCKIQGGVQHLMHVAMGSFQRGGSSNTGLPLAFCQHYVLPTSFPPPPLLDITSSSPPFLPPHPPLLRQRKDHHYEAAGQTLAATWAQQQEVLCLFHWIQTRSKA